MPIVSPDTWRARAQAWVPIVIEANPLITDIDRLWNTTRDTALYVPREYFREAVRGYNNEKTTLGFIEELGPDELIPRRWFTEGYKRMPEKYRYIVETTGQSIFTGETFSRTAAYDSPYQLTTAEIMSAVEEEMPDSAQVEMDPGWSMKFVHVYHKAGSQW